MIQKHTKELCGAKLVEVAQSNCEYVAAPVMPSKKDIFGNWTEKRMCGDYRKVNKHTKSNKNAMLKPEEIFETIGHGKIFSVLDL